MTLQESRACRRRRWPRTPKSVGVAATLLTLAFFHSACITTSFAEDEFRVQDQMPEELSITEMKSILGRRDVWETQSRQEVVATLMASIIYLGASGDESIIADLEQYYTFAQNRIDADTRDALLERVARGIEKRDISLDALLPFIFIEKEPSIVGAAVLNFIVLNGEDEVSSAQTAVSWFRTYKVASRAGVIAGMLGFGDRKVNAVLFEVRNEITLTELNQVVDSYPEFANLEAFEWWLSWMEERSADRNDQKFGLMASALANLVQKSLTPFFQTERGLDRLDSLERINRRRSLKVYFPEDVGHLYAERLYALEKREAPLKTVSHVLRLYGLDPHAPYAEQFRPEIERPRRSDSWVWIRVVYGSSDITAEKKQSSSSDLHSEGSAGNESEPSVSVARAEEGRLAAWTASSLGLPISRIFTISRLTLLDGKWKPTILMRIDPEADNRSSLAADTVREVVGRMEDANPPELNKNWLKVLVYP